jgi:uncharacterized protein
MIVIAAVLCGMPGALPVRAQQAGGENGAAKPWSQDPEWREVKYGPWGGSSTPPSGPMDSILLKDYAPKSSLVVPVTFVAKAKYLVIDAHTHAWNARTPAEVDAWVKTMDEVGVGMSIVLTMRTGAEFDKLVDLYLRRYPTRFQLYCGLLTANLDQPDYSERAAAELERCYRKGARGVGELIDKGFGYGFGYNKPQSQRLYPDDPRLDAFWNKAAELKIPVVLHEGDHPSCWEPLDVYQERSPDYQSYNLYGKNVPSLEELLAKRDRLLARHPQTTFIVCHLGNQGNDLATLSQVLDAHPNLYLDIAARDYEIGREPRAAARFLTKYKDRLVFGTDLGRDKDMYQAWWRLLETDDEYMPGRAGWKYYGLALPDPVLESLYRGTVKGLMNWDKL